jgi:muramoyltetrapeptide carboxypeptidase
MGDLERPARLEAGDKIAVVAPAGPLVPEQLDVGLETLGSWGLEVVEGPHARDRHPTFPYLAGSDRDRAADLQAAWCDPSVTAVFCARGGYGCLRLLDLLDWDAMAAAGPKLLVGSSDVTALHEMVRARLGLPTMFGPMLGTGAFVSDPTAQAHLRQVLFAPTSGTVLSGPLAEPLVPGTAQGVTVGGNLSLLCSAQGVPDIPPPPEGAIGLLEDVTEEPYRIDHFVTHLRRSGWFSNLSGVALGSWHECGEPAVVRAVLEDRLCDLGIPVIWELGFGHCPAQLTVPLGAEVSLVSDPSTGTASLTLVGDALR